MEVRTENLCVNESVPVDDIFEYFRLSKAVSIQQDQSSFNLCFFTQILSNAFTMYIFYQRVAAVSRF